MPDANLEFELWFDARCARRPKSTADFQLLAANTPNDSRYQAALASFRPDDPKQYFPQGFTQTFRR